MRRQGYVRKKRCVCSAMEGLRRTTPLLIEYLHEFGDVDEHVFVGKFVYEFMHVGLTMAMV